jgi:hypothetical protein
LPLKACWPPPIIKSGNPKGAQRWIDHWYAIYPAVEADHCINYLAHLVQRPAIKINHGIAMIGAPKIGKDSLLEPMETAVSSGNFKEITLTNLISKNNEFLRAVFVRLSEAILHRLGIDNETTSTTRRPARHG